MKPKILICRIGAFGDICMALPLVQSLCRHFEVHWLIRKSHIPLLKLFPQIAVQAIAVNPGKFRWFSHDLLHRLEGENYAALLDLSHWKEVSWLAQQLQSIPIRAIGRDEAQDARLWGRTDPGIYEPYNCRVAVSTDAHQIVKWQQLIHESLGIRIEPEWELPPPKPVSGTATLFVQPHSRNPAKRWPLLAFLSTIESLHRSRGLKVRINAGTVSEWPRAYLLRNALRRRGISAQVTPHESGYGSLKRALETSHYALGTDSGPMHLASLVGTPTLCIMGKYPAWEFAPRWRGFSISPESPRAWARDTDPRRVVDFFQTCFPTTGAGPC